MIVCSCNCLSDTQIRTTMNGSDGPRTPSQVYRCLGCTPRCGVCARTIRAILRDTEGVGLTACPSRHNCPIACNDADIDAGMSSGIVERSGGISAAAAQ